MLWIPGNLCPYPDRSLLSACQYYLVVSKKYWMEVHQNKNVLLTIGQRSYQAFWTSCSLCQKSRNCRQKIDSFAFRISPRCLHSGTWLDRFVAIKLCSLAAHSNGTLLDHFFPGQVTKLTAWGIIYRRRPCK